MKKAYLAVMLIFVVCYTNGQTKPVGGYIWLNNRVLNQANAMGQAFIKGDYKTFSKYTYPTLLKAM